MRHSVVLGFLVLSLMGAQVVSAGQVNVILESDADTAADLTLVNFLSQLNFLNGNAAFSFGSSFNVPASFRAGGFATNGAEFNLLLESNADTAADLTLVNFLSQLNFLNGNAAFSFGSSFNVPAGFSVAGFVFDSGQVNLLLESDADTAADLILVNFLSQLNFLNGNFAFSFGSSFNVPAGFSVAGFDMTDGQVNLLLESDADTTADLILVNFLSQLNFLNGNFAFSFGSSFNVPASFSVAGFEIEADATTPPPGAVPGPSALLLFGAAGMAAAILRWRRWRGASIGK